jgi:hypothetical protein
VRHVHSKLHNALNDAVRRGHLARSPADRADPPKPATPEMKAWSPEQLRTFLAHVHGDQLCAAWLLLATAGEHSGVVEESRVGASRTEPLRLAPSALQPIGIPVASVRIDHLQPSLARSFGFLPVPSPPQGLLCRLPSTATSRRSRPMIRS